ncbi:MAG: leucine-rich repeat domain-containing protein [Eubacteriales bacterium]
MKKLISLLLAALLLASVLPGCNRTPGNPEESAAKTTEYTLPYNPADASPASDFEYTVGEDGGITITKYIGTDTDMVIPEYIDGKPVTVIGERAFLSNLTVTSVSVPDSVTIMQGNIFQNCSSLTTVNLSRNLQVIGSMCFYNANKLSNITLPSSLTEIGQSAFNCCDSLKSIKIPASVTVWGANAFCEAGLVSVLWKTE